MFSVGVGITEIRELEGRDLLMNSHDSRRMCCNF